jgi:hypothetical protein
LIGLRVYLAKLPGLVLGPIFAVVSICALRSFLLFCRNQLNPVYTVNGMVICDPEDTKARSPKKPRDGKGEMLSLTTGDIEGARPATWGEQKVGVIRLDQRKNFTVTNRVDDIDGTSAGSRPKGICTQRPDTDPNERNYKLLDGKVGDPEDLLIGHGWYTAATNAVALEASGKLAPSRLAQTDENRVEGGDDLAASAGGRRTVSGSDMLSKSAWAAQKAAAAQLASSSGRGFTAYPQEKPTQRMARKLLDPRDAEIAALRGELESVRSRSAGAVRGGLRPPIAASALPSAMGSDDGMGGAAQGYENPYDSLRRREDGLPPSGKPSGLEIKYDPKATAKARASAAKMSKKELGTGIGLGTIPVADPAATAASRSNNDGELSFSQMLANTIKSGQASSNPRASPLKGTKSLSATSALTLMAGTKAGASQRHDTMALRRQARDREGELSAVRSLPI